MTLTELLIIILIWGTIVSGALIETFKWYPVTGKLEHNGVQYSDSIRALQKDTAQYIYFSRMDPGYGVRGMLFSVMHIQARIVIRYRAVDTAGTPPNFRWWIDGRDTTRSVSTGWKIQSDTQNLQSIIDDSVVFQGDTLLGYIKLDSIKYLPALFRIGIKSDSVRDSCTLKISNESYFDVMYKSLY